MPIANEFAPDIVLVSSGFDAVEGHPPPLGGYTLTSKCEYGTARTLTPPTVRFTPTPSSRRFRLPDQAADDPRRRPSGPGSGGGSRPHSHLRRLRGVRRRPARPGGKVALVDTPPPLVESLGTAASCSLFFCLQPDPLPKAVLEQRPNPNAVCSLEKVLETHSEFVATVTPARFRGNKRCT